MRPQKDPIVSGSGLHQWALHWLLQAELIKDRGRRRCSAAVVWSLVLRAAARMISLFAACRDLSAAPSQQAVFDALEAGLPRTLPVLENRLDGALTTSSWSRGLRRRRWQVAIDWHLVPYYGQAYRSGNELYRHKSQRGTTHSHTYATACIVQHGQRYTLALTWVRRHESMVRVLRRLLTRLHDIGVKIKVLLPGRAFFNTPVMAALQQHAIPFLMPVVISGRRPKRGKKGRAARKGLRWIKAQKAGWYRHTRSNPRETATFSVCVSYRRYRHHKTGRRGRQKLLFAAWKARGAPAEIRARYRKRFGIETSFRQMRQARIHTCTRNPHLRLVFVAVALLSRNLWVYVHAARLAGGRGAAMAVRLDRLRFKQMLDWIAQAVTDELHDGSMPYVNADE